MARVSITANGVHHLNHSFCKSLHARWLKFPRRFPGLRRNVYIPPVYCLPACLFACNVFESDSANLSRHQRLFRPLTPKLQSILSHSCTGPKFVSSVWKLLVPNMSFSSASAETVKKQEEESSTMSNHYK